jgi:hypothetical protein
MREEVTVELIDIKLAREYKQKEYKQAQRFEIQT